MKKKKIVLLGILILTISLTSITGCGEKEKKNQSTGSATVTENTEADVRESAGNTEMQNDAEKSKDAETLNDAERLNDTETQNDTKEPGDAEEKNDATVQNTAEPISYSTDDWKSLEFSLNGKVYRFPLCYTDFAAAGYTMDDSLLNEELESMQYTMTSGRAKSEAGEQIRISFKNTTDQTIAIKDASVRAVVLSAGSYGNENTTFGLCNGIQNGDSIDTVIAAMGEEPGDRYEGSSMTSLTYKFEAHGTVMKSSIKFSFDETGLYEMEITNMDF